MLVAQVRGRMTADSVAPVKSSSAVHTFPPLLSLVLFPLFFFSLLSISSPFPSSPLPPTVSMGRFVMNLLGMTQAPEIYTAAIGLYGLWLIIRLLYAVVHYISLGIKTFTSQIHIWTIQVNRQQLYWF